jgi:hypothetical protein
LKSEKQFIIYFLGNNSLLTLSLFFVIKRGCLLFGHEKNIGFLKLKGLFSEINALKSLLSLSIYFLSAGECLLS